MVGALVGLEQATLHQHMSHKVSNVRGCAIEVADGYEYRLVVKPWNGQDETQYTCIYIHSNESEMMKNYWYHSMKTILMRLI
jgi:hypothetical protein